MFRFRVTTAADSKLIEDKMILINKRKIFINSEDEQKLYIEMKDAVYE